MLRTREAGTRFAGKGSRRRTTTTTTREWRRRVGVVVVVVVERPRGMGGEPRASRGGAIA